MSASCTAEEAVTRAQKMVNKGGQYLYGTGDYQPFSSSVSDRIDGFVDLPWTLKNGEQGSDCAGFAICWAWKLKRHRPGFNKGEWASIEDDINVNSILEDAQHHQELSRGIVGEPKIPPPCKPGDLLCYPTFYVKGVTRPFIGHVALIEKVPDGWFGGYDALTVIQCHGPDHFKPGVIRSNGYVFTQHDAKWPGDSNRERRCKIVRMKERV